MKKVWEETWRERNSPATTSDIYNNDGGYIFLGMRQIGEPGFDEAEARAKLAAAAPDLARLVLHYEWNVNAQGCTPEGGCPSCLASRLDGHEPDCALVRVLDKAGIRKCIDIDVRPPRTCAPRLASGKQENQRLREENAALKAELDTYRDALEDIASAHPSEGDQTPWWAKKALCKEHHFVEHRSGAKDERRGYFHCSYCHEPRDP